MFFGSTPNFSAVDLALSGWPLTSAVSLAIFASLNAGMICPSPSWPRPMPAKLTFLPDAEAAATASSCACASDDRATAAAAMPAAVVWRKLRRVDPVGAGLGIASPFPLKVRPLYPGRRRDGSDTEAESPTATCFGCLLLVA